MKKHFCNLGEISEKIKNIDPHNNMKYSTWDDVTYGTLFADTFKNCSRYNVTSKGWYVYNGIFWEHDAESMYVERYSQMFYHAWLTYSMDFELDYQKFVLRLGSRPTRIKMIADARHHYAISQEVFDSDKNLLNVQNGVINLTTYELMKHNRDYLFSKVANVTYNPDASSIEWHKFISDVTCEDKEKALYLQKVISIGLTADTCEEECYVLFGASTRNGKSTLLETIGYMLGGYSSNIQPETLAQRKKDSRTASGDIARLQGCRFLHMSEPPKRMIFDVALLKTMLGRDAITTRRLYESEFEFIPEFTLYINTNYLPTVADDTLFSSGRIKVITFDRHFEEHEQDKTLKNRLKRSENLSGVLNWCLEGLRLYRAEGVCPPESVISATDDYRAKSDKIQTFIDEVLIEDESSSLKASDLYREYSSWCRSNGYGIENKGNFFADIRSKNLMSVSGTVDGVTCRNVIRGYRLDTDYIGDNNPFEMT